MAGAAGNRSGRSAGLFPFTVAMDAQMLHDLLLFQFSRGFQLLDTADLLGEKPVADPAVFQALLVLPVRQAYVPPPAAVDYQRLRPPVLVLGTDSGAKGRCQQQHQADYRRPAKLH